MSCVRACLVIVLVSLVLLPRPAGAGREWPTLLDEWAAQLGRTHAPTGMAREQARARRAAEDLSVTASAASASRAPGRYSAGVSDGAGGIIAASVTGREGYNYIYLQRVNSAGVTLWSTTGPPICSSQDAWNEYPVLVSDNAGGAIVAWLDKRDPSAHAVYAQRVDPDGSALWTPGGRLICNTASSRDGAPVMVDDGAGGAIIAWADRRFGDSDIFAQRIDADGNPYWAACGVEVHSEHTGWQENPVISSDGSLGAIVCWMDGRNLGYALIYAQRLDPSGSRLWDPAGTPVCAAATAHQQSPQVSRRSGVAVSIVWDDRRNGGGDIYAQRMDFAGARLWDPNGVTVCTAAGDQTSPDIAGDLAGGAIIAWRDFRSDVSGDIYTQRLSSSDGAPLWTPNGVPVCTATGNQHGPSIVPDVGGGAVLTWSDERSGPFWEARVYAQSVNANGVPRWSADGVPVCTDATSGQTDPTIVRDGTTGGAFILWYDHRNLYDDLYGQRLDSLGVALWPGQGVGLHLDPGVQRQARTIVDGAGNTILAWMEDHRGDYNICARKFDAAGDPLWPKVVIGVAAGPQVAPSLVSDGAGGAIVTWSDARRRTDVDIYAQRLDAAGTRLWPDTGVVVCAVPGWQINMQLEGSMVSDGQGGAIVCWSDLRGTDIDIYAQRVDATGATQWAANGIPVCSAPGDQPESWWSRGFSIASDGAGGAFVAWSDGRWQTHNDVYLQHLTPSGVDPAWPVDGRGVCNAPGDQYDVTATSDGQGGVIVAWVDERGPASTAIYAQRLSAAGGALWLPDGSPAEPSAGYAWLPRVISDGTGGAILAWTSGGDIRAQRLSGAGGTQWWPAGGVLVCGAGGEQTLPSLVPDGQNGAIVVWHDWRAGGALASLDLYAQRLDPSGALQWGANGVALCSAAQSQLYPACVSDGSGGVIAFWEDHRDGVADYLYAQRLNGSGQPQWPGGPVATTSVHPIGTGAAPGLRLAGARPNPARHGLTVTFSLPTAAPATLEVLDVGGRLRVSRSLAALGAGSHTLRLAEADRLPAGIYFIRLAQEGRAVTAKACVVR